MCYKTVFGTHLFKFRLLSELSFAKENSLWAQASSYSVDKRDALKELKRKKREADIYLLLLPRLK